MVLKYNAIDVETPRGDSGLIRKDTNKRRRAKEKQTVEQVSHNPRLVRGRGSGSCAAFPFPAARIDTQVPAVDMTNGWLGQEQEQEKNECESCDCRGWLMANGEGFAFSPILYAV